MKNDKCVSLSVVKKELRKLADSSAASGEHELARKFESQLGRMEGRSRMGGAGEEGARRKDWDRCDKITTAMLMTAGAGLAYLAYTQVLPSVMKIVPTTCGGVWDRVRGGVISLLDESASCYARQKKWEDFRNAIITGVFGAAGFGHKVLGFLKMDKEGMREKYDKLYEFNRKHVCPYFEEIAEAAEEGECIEGPTGELRRVLEENLKGDGATRASTRKRSRRQPAFWEMLHPGASSGSSSSGRSRSPPRHNKTAKKARRSHSRSPSKAKTAAELEAAKEVEAAKVAEAVPSIVRSKSAHAIANAEERSAAAERGTRSNSGSKKRSGSNKGGRARRRSTHRRRR